MELEPNSVSSFISNFLLPHLVRKWSSIILRVSTPDSNDQLIKSDKTLFQRTEIWEIFERPSCILVINTCEAPHDSCQLKEPFCHNVPLVPKDRRRPQDPDDQKSENCMTFLDQKGLSLYSHDALHNVIKILHILFQLFYVDDLYRIHHNHLHMQQFTTATPCMIKNTW